VIFRADGSTPQKAGVKALIDATGRIEGTLGGGPVEAEAQRRAVEACRCHCPVVFDLSLRSADASASAAVCGGSMRLLIDPTLADAAENRQAYAQAADAAQLRRRGVLLTTVAMPPGATANADVANPNVANPNVTVQWLPEEAAARHAAFPGGEAIAACLAGEVPRLFLSEPAGAAEAVEVFAEPVIPPPRLLIAGGGHVGQAVARQASQLGFDVTVMDDRPEFTEAALFPQGVATRCGPLAAQMAAFPLAEDTYVVIVTRGHTHDAEALAACIHAPLAYLGMIGSRRKVALMRGHFLQAGLASEAEFDRVCAPIGLEIGAVTVPEIATSIAAQLVAVRRRAEGGRRRAEG
jgi:xanthine dehydrogenase accessory factor